MSLCFFGLFNYKGYNNCCILFFFLDNKFYIWVVSNWINSFSSSNF